MFENFDLLLGQKSSNGQTLYTLSSGHSSDQHTSITASKHFAYRRRSLVARRKKERVGLQDPANAIGWVIQ